MLVGSSASTTFGSTASARAMATRCRCPPESWCGYLSATLSGGVQAHGPQELVDTFVEHPPRHDVVEQQRPGQMVADRLDRIEGRERILEDDLNLGAVMQIVFAAPQLRGVAAFEEHGAGRGRLQPCEEARDRALAAPAFADEGRDRPGLELERDVVDGVNLRSVDLAAEQKPLLEIPDIERAHDVAPSTRWQAT